MDIYVKIFLFSVDLFPKIMYNSKCMIAADKQGTAKCSAEFILLPQVVCFVKAEL